MNKQEFFSVSFTHKLKVMVDTSHWFEPKGDIPMELAGLFDFDGFYTMKYLDSSGTTYTDNLWHFKPIVRRLDDIKNSCVQSDFNDGKPFIPIDVMRDLCTCDIDRLFIASWEDLWDDAALLLESAPWKFIQCLAGWHFDLITEECEKFFVSDIFNPYK